MLLFGSLLGLVFIVAVMAMAIRILRQPVHRYQGDLTPMSAGRVARRWPSG